MSEQAQQQPPETPQGGQQQSTTEPTPQAQEGYRHAMQSQPEERQKAIEAIKAREQESQKDQSAETVKEPAPEPNKGLDANRLAVANAKLEKQIRDQKARMDELAKIQSDYQSLTEGLKDPNKRYQLLEQHGGNLSEYTNRILEGQQPQKDPRDLAIEDLKAKHEALQNELKQRAEYEQKARVQQSIEGAKQYARKFVHEQHADKYPVIAALNRSEAILYEAQKRHQNGEAVTGEEAEHSIAAAVESNLTEALKKEFAALSKTETFRTIMGELGYTIDKKAPSQAAQETQQRQTKPTVSDQQRRTLTNDLSAEPSGDVNFMGMSDRELRERAGAIASQREREEASRRGLV